MSTVISVEEVSKLYRLGEIGTGSLAHDVNRWWHKVRGNEDPYLKVGQSNDRTSKGDSDYVYAIQDVSFEVKQGEALGIIGRNGAGKSTLLKILSRVTTPTSGQIKAKGRIASLLEVGTGFHPELTGRENIFLNGAILGMRRSEIRDKFDEIVDFSGCERYIDTPVKRYSSGMYVRLAFAVAAHLEPEILIVDEVLAVGDADFQKKCLGKMKDVAGHGRTVIFVSHNMAAVKMLCKNSILLSEGRLDYSGATEDCIDLYNGNQSKTISPLLTKAQTLDSSVRIKSIIINGKTTDEIILNANTNTLNISIIASVNEPKPIELELLLSDQHGSSLAFFSPGHEEGITPLRQTGEFRISHSIKLPERMNHGRYFLKLSLTHHMVKIYSEIDNVVLYVEGVPTKTGKILEYGIHRGWLFLDGSKQD